MKAMQPSSYIKEQLMVMHMRHHVTAGSLQHYAQASMRECDERGLQLTKARVKGKTEYMPAARSRYETARSAAMTGWMTVALMILKKRVVAYSAPSTLVSPP